MHQFNSSAEAARASYSADRTEADVEVINSRILAALKLSSEAESVCPAKEVRRSSSPVATMTPPASTVPKPAADQQESDNLEEWLDDFLAT